MAIVMILPSSVQAGIILMVYSHSPFINFADMPTNQAVHCGCTFSSVSMLPKNCTHDVCVLFFLFFLHHLALPVEQQEHLYDATVVWC